MPNYKANFNYFDNIDKEEKAYWLGFIWADGYVCKRNRPDRTEYNLKLSLQSNDELHIQKFIDCLDGNYPIHTYKSKGFEGAIGVEKRLFLTNKHMCSLLYEKYGIAPNRHDPNKLINAIPKEFYRYFILGLFDADGSFTAYKGNYGEKLTVCFGGSKEILDFIECYFDEIGLTPKNNRGKEQRHKDNDGYWLSTKYCGIPQGSKILNWLYKDSKIHLDRKYEKYLSIPYMREYKIGTWKNR